MGKTALIIPTRLGGRCFADLLKSLEIQTFQPDWRIIIDSGSTDQTVALARSHGFQIHTIPAEEFNHGTTRQLGAMLAPEATHLIYLTQDAILAEEGSLEKLMDCFDRERVGAAYGRQLPRPDSGLLEAHGRLFNYPDKSIVKSMADTPVLGIKTPFCSDSFAAYRREALEEVGGFPIGVIQCEDMFVVAKMILAGWECAYSAEATVFHSHDLSVIDEFRRYFDTGVFHAQNPWIRQRFGHTGNEGLRMLKSQIQCLWGRSFIWIPVALFRAAVKVSAFRLGLGERWIPRRLKSFLSQSPAYWRTEP